MPLPHSIYELSVIKPSPVVKEAQIEPGFIGKPQSLNGGRQISGLSAYEQ